ncbi:MAG: hypothetical protein QXP02_04240 [Desulfurococcaceae archaeon]
MKYEKLIAILLVLPMLIGGLAQLMITPMANADEAVPMESIAMDTEVLSQNEVSIAITTPKLSFEEALNMAYVIRNMTYELFEWEISYNLTVANKSLSIGDLFINRAIEMNAEGNVKRAIAFAIVAASHYSHAPAFANAVLARVVPATMVNGTISNETVEAVIKVAGELKQILTNAVEYAVSNNYNVSTRVYSLIERGDHAISMANDLLSQGNVTGAFAYSVIGYRSYVKAYSLLVKETYAQSIKIALSDNVTSSVIKRVEKPWLPSGLIDKLPEEIRETIRKRLENATGKGLGEIIDKVREEVEARIEERSRKELEIVASILEKTINQTALKEMVKDKSLREFCRELIIEIRSKTNTTGLQLLRDSLNELQQRLRERGIDIQVNITSRGVRAGKAK